MTDENKIVEEHECKCLCHSKGFRKFLIVAGGSFVGVFLALSLFTALHKPPMPVPMPCPCHYNAMRVQHFDRYDRGPRGEFHKKHFKNFDGKKFVPKDVKQEIPEIED